MDTITKILEDMTTIAARRADDELLLAIRKKLQKLKKENAELAEKLSRIISNAGGLGAMRRFNGLENMPKDTDSGMDLLTHFEGIEYSNPPILPPQTQKLVDRFVLERENATKLKAAGVSVPSSLALIGRPGTGKTSLAVWMASRLNLPIYCLNIASVITSYLGQTGQNIKKALERAKYEPCLLFLDEFDALGYQRSGQLDVGEMRRVVTVLLQEIEFWPEESIVIAATNLPEQLDIGFKRRFSRWIELPLPEFDIRLEILRSYYSPSNGNTGFLEALAAALPGASGADLKSIAHRIKASEILYGKSSREAIWPEIERELISKEFNEDDMKLFIKKVRKADPKFFTFRKIGSILQISHTTASNLAKQ